MYKFVALLVVLSSVSLTLASPYGSRLMSHSSSYGAAPAPVAPAPGIFEVPAATPFVEVTTAGYGQRAISKEVVITEVVTPAPELPVPEVTQAYGSVPTTTQGYNVEVPVTQIALEETTTAGYGQRAISKEVVITEVVTEAPTTTQGYGSAPVLDIITEAPTTTTMGYGNAPVLDVVTPAPELPVAPIIPVTQGYNSAPVTEIALEETTTTPFVEVTTAGYGQRAISKEVVITEVVTPAPELPVAPVTQGYGSAPVFKASSY